MNERKCKTSGDDCLSGSMKDLLSKEAKEAELVAGVDAAAEDGFEITLEDAAKLIEKKDQSKEEEDK